MYRVKHEVLREGDPIDAGDAIKFVRHDALLSLAHSSCAASMAEKAMTK
jgi:hypothetical protein